ncbi:MAG: YHS domain-containing protein, partial [Candidatus Eremiobacterota bacterium]
MSSDPLEETVKVRITRMPSSEPSLKPGQRWALLTVAGALVGLVVYCAMLFSRPASPPSPEVAVLTPAPPSAPRARPSGVPTAADGSPLVDLVCGAPVDDTAPYRSEFAGRTFFFAHAQCLESFRAQPARYVKVRYKVKIQMSPDSEPAEATIPEEEPVPEEEPALEPVPSDPAAVSE